MTTHCPALTHKKMLSPALKIICIIGTSGTQNGVKFYIKQEKLVIEESHSFFNNI